MLTNYTFSVKADFDAQYTGYGLQPYHPIYSKIPATEPFRPQSTLGSETEDFYRNVLIETKSCKYFMSL